MVLSQVVLPAKDSNTLPNPAVPVIISLPIGLLVLRNFWANKPIHFQPLLLVVEPSDLPFSRELSQVAFVPTLSFVPTGLAIGLTLFNAVFIKSIAEVPCTLFGTPSVKK